MKKEDQKFIIIVIIAIVVILVSRQYTQPQAVNIETESHVTRTIPASLDAGEQFMVFIDVRVKGGETFYLIDEVYPEEFTLIGPGIGDGTTNPGHIFWVVKEGAVDYTYNYVLKAPDTPGTYDFSGTYGFEDGEESSIVGDVQILVKNVPIVPDCVEDDDCPQPDCGYDLVCTDGECVPHYGDALPCALPDCTIDSDCPQPLCGYDMVCTDGECVETLGDISSCVPPECSVDDDCAVPICDGGWAECVDGECESGCESKKLCQFFDWAPEVGDLDSCIVGIGIVFIVIMMFIILFGGRR